ncbi:MAG: isoprenylcysteine carboxylmethyltransferase family protein [Acidobacteriaceae bacterium]|nr:isoprenylcysteine carboxylmethyltransferase family protein [Acidobacteriaceae bacterium]
MNLDIIDYTWIFVAVVWLAAAFRTKQPVRQYSGAARAVQIVLLVLAVMLLFVRRVQMGYLGTRLFPPSNIAYTIGVVLLFAGVLFAFWARFFLGRNWSGEITVKQDHQLIRSGPYALVRHPIYSGFIFAMLGTAIAFGQLRGFLGVVLAAIGWRLKSLIEERYMVEQFGAEYTNYKQSVKALVPFIW